MKSKAIEDLSSIELAKGHRQRLKNKFKISKNSLEDYELLEMLLFYVFARKDTKPIAKKLMIKFNNNLDNVINADVEQLKEVNGIGDGVINLFKLIQEINCRILRKNINVVGINNINTSNDEIKLNNLEAVKNYCKNKIGNLLKEEVLVLFLNNKCNLVAEEVIGMGSTNETKLCNSLIVTKAVSNASSKIVLVHNHPTGDATPSVNDIVLTKHLKNLLSNFGIILLEHIVVSKNNAVGIIESGMLD